MKSLLVLISLLLGTSAFAASPKQPSVIKAQELKITRVKCPPGRVCAAVLRYQIEATYRPVGCADEVEAKAYDAGIDEASGRRVIELIGLNYSRGKNIKCAHHPLKTIKIGIGGSPNVKIVQLKKLSDMDEREE